MYRKLVIICLALFISVTLQAKNYAVIALDDIFTIFPVDDVPPIDPQMRQAFLDAINQARSHQQDCGDEGVIGPSNPVTWNDKLYRAAYLHAYDLAVTNTFSHTGSGTATDVAAQALHPGQGSTPGERITYQGYQWHAYGENIAGGQPTVHDVINAWLESPGHCANLMNPLYTEVGMALIENADSTYTFYWVQDFAAPK